MKPPEELSEDELLHIGHIEQARGTLAKAEDLANASRLVRDEHINALRVLGWTIADCATLAGMSQGHVQKIGERAGLKSVRTARAR